MPPSRTARRPRVIDYSMLNMMERRLVQRRPLNMWSVLALRKPQMRRFLRSNGQRYKTKDRKKRLMRLIIDLIRRHDLRAVALRQSNLRMTSTSQTPEQNVLAPKIKKSKLVFGEHVRGKRCKCTIALSELLDTPLQLPHNYVIELRKLMSAAPTKVEGVIQVYGGEPNAIGCNVENLKTVRDLFVQDLQALRGLWKKEDEQTKCNALQCGICCDESQMCVTEPCGHMVCTNCAAKMESNCCPICRRYVDSRCIINLPGIKNIQILKTKKVTPI